jgi:peptidoglycan hydrolase CwlO-like protein
MDEVTKIRVDYATMTEKVDNLCEKVDKIDNKIDNLDKRYAGRWVEVVAVGMLIAILAQIAVSS